MMEQPPPARARMPKIATCAKRPTPLTMPPHCRYVNDHIFAFARLMRNIQYWPHKLASDSRKPDFYSSETPAGEGIGTPKPGTPIGPVGAIERKARVSARTDARASRSTWRVRPAFRTLTNMSHFLALTPVNHYLQRETSRV